MLLRKGKGPKLIGILTFDETFEASAQSITALQIKELRDTTYLAADRLRTFEQAPRFSSGITRVIFVVLLLILALPSNVKTNQIDQIEILTFRSLGIPSKSRQQEAKRINELFMFRDRLYIGTGDATVNTGPTELLYYDFSKLEFGREFTVDEEAIQSFSVIDSMLSIPGVDATESWEFGNIYLKLEDGWRKRRTIPKGVHVFDLVSGPDGWYAGAGTVFELYQGAEHAFGCIYRSTDRGDSWQISYATPTDPETVYRIHRLHNVHGQLYAFFYGYSGMAEDEIPEGSRHYLGSQYEGEYLIFRDDLFGAQDVLVYDGKRWQYRDIVPQGNICHITPYRIGENLLLSVLSGRYLSLFATEGAKINRSFYWFDGVTCEPMSLPFTDILDIVTRENRSLILARREGLFVIVETRDFLSWKLNVLPSGIQTPTALEYYNGVFLIGTNDGNVFISTAATPTLSLEQAKGLEPLEFLLQAELPRDGMKYWAAITGWQEWGSPAQLHCMFKEPNTIELTTLNVSQCVVYPPLLQLDHELAVRLVINGVTAYQNKFSGKKAIKCHQNSQGSWVVKAHRDGKESFTYQKHIVGRSLLNLSTAGTDPAIGRWYTEVLRWATKAEVAIAPRDSMLKELVQGQIALEDIYDSFYNNKLVTFTATGEELCRMLNFAANSTGLPYLQISGFTAIYRNTNAPVGCHLDSCTLEATRKYRVALNDYTAKNSLEILGREVVCSEYHLSVRQAMIRWFEAFNKIEVLPSTTSLLP